MLIVTVVASSACSSRRCSSDSRPVLGLDLQGGISIVLFPVKGTDLSALNTAVDVIRNRVDGLGIAEPDVQRQGNTIVVNLPGVKDRAKAESLVGETAELRFRPVQYAGRPAAHHSRWTPSDDHHDEQGRDHHDGARARRPRRRTGATTTTAERRRARRHRRRPRRTSGKAAARRRSRPRRSSPASPRTPRRRTAAAATTATATHGRPTTAAGSTPTTMPGTTTTTAPTAFPGCEQLIKQSPPDTDAAQAGRAARPQAAPSCYVLGPAIVTGKSVGSASVVVRLHRVAVGHQRALQEQRLRQQDRGPVRQQAGRDRARRRRAVGADDQPGHHRPRRRDHRAASPRARRKQLALVLRYGALPVQFDQHEADRRERVADARQGPAHGRHRRRASSASASSRSTCCSSTGCSGSS